MADTSNDLYTLKYKRRCMQYSLLHQTPATETVYDRIQTHPKYRMGFLSHLEYGSNLVEIPTILNYYFLCLSSTPKDSTNSMPMTFPESNSSLHQGKGNSTGMQTQLWTSEHPRKAHGRRDEGWATAYTGSFKYIQCLDLFIINFSSEQQTENRKHRNFTV